MCVNDNNTERGITMKKVISIMMCLVFLLCLSSPAFASTPSENSLDGQGVSFSSVDCTMTIGEGETAEVYPVGKIVIYLNDPESVTAALENENVASEIKAYISARYAAAKESGNTDIVLTLLSQNLCPASRGMLEPVYRTINGIQMRTDCLEETGLPKTANIASGSQLRTVLGDLSNITISTLGLVDYKKVPLVAGGISLLSALIAAGQDTYLTGARDDKAILYIKYNNKTQWTYGYTGAEWQLGLVSQKAEIVELSTYIYMYNDGNTKEKTISRDPDPSEDQFQSVSYGSPWTVAYQNLNAPITEWLRTTIYGTTIYF